MLVKLIAPLRFPALLPVMLQVFAVLAPINVSVPAPPLAFTFPTPLTEPDVISSIPPAPFCPTSKFKVPDAAVNVPPLLVIFRPADKVSEFELVQVTLAPVFTIISSLAESPAVAVDNVVFAA